MKWKYKFYTGRPCPKVLDFHSAFDTISSSYFTTFLMVFYVLSITSWETDSLELFLQ